MAFKKVPYLEWAHSKPAVKYNLTMSGVDNTTPEELGCRWEGIRFSGNNQYGYLPLLEAIAGRHGVLPANVVTASGTSMANFLAVAALIERGDEVIIEKPCYGPLIDLPVALGARIKRLPREFTNGFQIDPADLRRLASRKTKLIIISNLHNPSGVQIPQSTLEEIGDIAKTCKARVLVDEVYLDFLFGNTPPTSFRIDKQFIVTSSLTKVYGLDGLRCGWILCDEKLAQGVWRVRDYIDVNGSFPAEQMACRLFHRLPEVLGKTMQTVASNFPLVARFIASRPELSWVPPAGGIICFPRHRRPSALDRFHETLVREHETLVVPGKFFELRAHFRLGFGLPSALLSEGLANVGKALDSCS